MKRLFVLLVVGWLGCWAVGGSAAYGLSADVNLAYVSKYIWRGQDQNNGQPALQPGATFYLGNTGLSLGLWGNYNVGGIIGKQFTEIDYTVTYASAFNDNWNYSVYYSQYTYPPEQSVRTGELFFALTGNSVPFTPTLTVSYDNDQGKGAYASLAGRNSFYACQQKIDCQPDRRLR